MDGRALLIAIEEFRLPGLEYLQAPVSDAKILATTLRREDVGRYRVDPVVRNPDRRELLETLSSFFADVRDNDVAFIHIATHGIVDERGNLYLATSDTNVAVPTTALSAADLAGYVRDCLCPRVVVFLDCCYASRSFLGEMQPSEQSIKDKLGRIDAASGSGKAIIASSFARGRAYERDGTSVFTGHLIRGLSTGRADVDEDGIVTVENLFEFLSKAMESDPQQTPRMLADIVKPRMALARSPRGQIRPFKDRYKQILENGRADIRTLDDLRKRYLIDDPADADHIREQVDRTVDYWAEITKISDYRYLSIVRKLQRDHEDKYEALFADPIGARIYEVQRQLVDSAPRSDDLRSKLRSQAGPWRRCPRREAEELRQRFGATTEEIDEICADLDIVLAEPDRLVALPPVAKAQGIQQALQENGLRHVVDLIWGAAQAQHWSLTGLVGDAPIAVDDRPDVRFDDAAVASERPEATSPALNAVWAELELLTTAELGLLLRWQIAEAGRDAVRKNVDLIKALRRFGVIDAESRRLGYALSREPKSRGGRVGQIGVYLDQGQLHSAHGFIQQRPENSRSVDEAEALLWLDRRVRRAEELREAAKQQTDTRSAWRDLDLARLLVSDLPGLDEVAAGFPPPEPTGISIDARGGVVEIRWETAAGTSPDISYTVGRKTAAGAKYVEIPVRAEGSGRAYDNNPPAGRPLWYAVTAQRRGVRSATVPSEDPVYLYPPVSDLSAAYEGSRVMVAWRPHPDSSSVTVSRHGDQDDDTLTIEVRGDEFADDKIVPGRTYLYEVVALYHLRGSGPAASESVSVRITADRPGTPVLSLSVRYSRVGRLAVEADSPDVGALVIAISDKQPPTIGTVVREQTFRDVAAFVAFPIGAHQLEIAEPNQACWLSAVTVVADNYTYGARQRFVPIPAIEGHLIVHRRGDRMQVCWPWPRRLAQAEVVATPAEGPPQWATVTLASYQDGGGVWLASTGAAVTVQVRPIGNAGGTVMYGVGISTRLPARPVVRYSLAPAGTGPGSVAVSVVADCAVRGARLRAVVSDASHQPLEEFGGTAVWDCDDLDLAAGESRRFTFTLAQPPPEPAWLRCFARDDDIELLDPPIAEQYRKWGRR